MRVLLALLLLVGVVGRADDSSPHSSGAPPAKATETPAVSEQEAIAKLKSLGAQVEVREGAVIRVKFIGNNSHLDDSQLSFLADLISLEQLNLSRTGVTDELLKRFAGLHRLKSLRLYQTKVTWIGISELEKQSPQLKVVATPPRHRRPSWIPTMINAFVLLLMGFFLLTGFFFVRGLSSQFAHVAQLRSKMERGQPVSPGSFVSSSSSRMFCSASMGFGAIFALIGGGFLVSGMFEAIQSSMAKDWPTAEGHVVVSRVISQMGNISDDGDSTAYAPVIIYQYEIDGAKYVGDQVATYRLANHTAKTIDQRFPVGPVIVSYNPDNPEEAVLLPGLGSANFIFIGLGGICCLVGLVILVIALVKRRRNVSSEPGPM